MSSLPNLGNILVVAIDSNITISEVSEGKLSPLRNETQISGEECERNFVHVCLYPMCGIQSI